MGNLGGEIVEKVFFFSFARLIKKNRRRRRLPRLARSWSSIGGSNFGPDFSDLSRSLMGSAGGLIIDSFLFKMSIKNRSYSINWRDHRNRSAGWWIHLLLAASFFF